jgi:very-short-patch-repair endonuclease
LDWLYATEFYQLYEEDLEILPQFPIGDYLRQLDPKYMHPAYKVDFLLTYSHAKGILHIVVEYDGFEYHFRQDADIDAGNHERYLTDSDIERQLTLESYGYKFIRINRFNLGKDPVKTLSDRLYRLVDQSLQKKSNDLVSNLQNQANSLINKTAKQCSSCEQIKDHQAFFDQKLKKGSGGFGRICIECKSKNENDSLQKHTKFRRRKWA